MPSELREAPPAKMSVRVRAANADISMTVPRGVGERGKSCFSFKDDTLPIGGKEEEEGRERRARAKETIRPETCSEIRSGFIMRGR